MAIGTTSVSDDGNLLAYTTDTTGFRDYKLYVRDLRTGELLEQPAEKVTSVDWAADNRTLFYTTTDAAKRPYRLYRHAIGADGGGTMLYEEKDERFSVGVGRSRSKAFLFLEIGSLTTSEVHYLGADQPSGDVEDRRAAQGQPRVRRRSPRRSVLHPHQPGRPQLRAGRGAGERSVAGAVEDDRPAPRRRDAAVGAGLRGPDGAVRAGQRPAAVPRRQGRRRGVRHLDGAAVPRAGVHRLAGRQPRVQDADVPLRATSRSRRRSRCSTTTSPPASRRC